MIGQAVLTGGPVVLALAGGSARDITALFAGLALFRAPYIVALGLVSQLTGRFTGWSCGAGGTCCAGSASGWWA